ncbi:DUF2584 domain-containing protein [Halalkalibacillus sediminis]|uniref:DUF2584 domain-containing protein n=1 Tax=Halalkalibacillus sediminis TaxID=2018042 RepID=A0A2I0QWS4_9BACI|nr:DUF2584 family protein [Halalkalibacillus sediminis]PKR78796.1 DUF2584 domain-containing protein [Halalkalibacillus sediminis]
MAQPFMMEWKIVTHGKERRINEETDLFEIEFEGYKIFPILEPIKIMRKPESDQIGTAKIVKLTIEEGKTICHYHLVSLQSVN